MRGFSRSLVYLIIFAIVAVICGVFVVNAINRPIAAKTASYTAKFTNVSGLRVGNDVRMFGVPVGKVTAIDLEQKRAEGDGSMTTDAKVKFTLDKKQSIYGDTKLAIRYLNLTGIRYIDVQQGTSSGPTQRPKDVITTAQTIPSFDVTQIFKGFAPVLQAMDPNDINHFANSMLALVQGDGSGFGDIISSLSKVVKFADDRQQIINTLVANLKTLSDSLGGKSSYLNPIIGYVGQASQIMFGTTEQFRELSNTGGPVFAALDNLLAAVGIQPGTTADFHAFAKQLLPAAESVIGLLGLTPGILNTLNQVLPASGTPATLNCSKGRAQLPSDVALFLRGTQVTLCNR
jgi:phospholipid/cholesterol/gamma-HCH transport system substrate-binding protein